MPEDDDVPAAPDGDAPTAPPVEEVRCHARQMRIHTPSLPRGVETWPPSAFRHHVRHMPRLYDGALICVFVAPTASAGR